jgi:hypothetical protein
VAKAKATKAKRKEPVEKAPPRRAASAKAPSAKPTSGQGVGRSTRPPPAEGGAPGDLAQGAPDVLVPSPPPSAARWEERADKDAYALDLLERLVRYYGGRASATSSEVMRSAAFVLSTLTLGLATADEEQLAALARAARELRKSGPVSSGPT